MDETQKSRNNRGGNKKMSGGGIGAILLLSGALATAALASFAASRKRRSSGGDHRQNSSPDINKKIEDTREEAEEEGGMEDVIISDERLKMEVESDDGFVKVKEEISLCEKEKVELINEESKNLAEGEEAAEVVEVSPEKKEWEVLCNEEKCVKKTILPLFEDPVTQQDNLVGYEFDEEAKKSCLADDSSEVKEEKIFPVIEMDEANEEASMQKKDSEKEVDQVELVAPEEAIEKEVEEVEGNMGNWEVAEKKIVQQFVISQAEEEEESVDSSNWKAPIQADLLKESVAPQQAKLMKYEMGGKIMEDPKVYIPLVADTNSSTRRMIILTVSVLSSLSCSWFFNLSSAKLCLVAFLTIFLLEIYGYSLLNHDAKGDGRS